MSCFEVNLEGGERERDRKEDRGEEKKKVPKFFDEVCIQIASRVAASSGTLRCEVGPINAVINVTTTCTIL
jgi:hypothetical protein